MRKTFALSILALSPAANAELLRQAHFDYDEMGRLIRERHADPATGSDVVTARYTYDAEGRLRTSSDAAGRTTTLSYDALGRVATTTDAAGGTATFAYDAADRVVRVVDPRGLVTGYDFDGFGQLRQQRSPDTGTTTFEYAASGLPTTITRNDARITTFTHDGAGRVTRVAAGSSERRFGYDTCFNGKGRLCSASTREEGLVRSTASHMYTPEGWVTRRRDSGVDEVGNAYDDAVVYSHDGMGRVASAKYPSGVNVGYVYEAGDLVTMTAVMGGVVHTVASNITRQPFGPVDGWTYGNGLERLHDFDRRGRLFGISSGTSHTLVQSLTYGFNNADEITAITNGVDGSHSRKFQYDALGRLSKETQHASQWAYDANGNGTSRTHAGKVSASVIDSHSNRVLQLSAFGATIAYGYDALGNRTSETGAGRSAAYAYDDFGRLRSATVNGAASEYTVNALDQRVGKSTPSGRTRFVYEGQNRLLAEHDAGGWTSYLWLGSELVGLVKPDGLLRYVHNDHLGRPELVSNATAQPVWRANNAEYDRTVVLDQIGGLNIGFPGQYRDAETGLWHNGYRDGYDGGGFTQSDPIGLGGGSFSTYAYANSNPISNIDPFGLAKVSIGAGGNAYFATLGGSIESSVGIDTSGNVCYVSTICDNEAAIGAGAGLGVSAGGGKGEYCDSDETTEQTRAELTVGMGGGMTVSNDLSSRAVGRGLVGWSTGVSFETCRVITKCINLLGD